MKWRNPSKPWVPRFSMCGTAASISFTPHPKDDFIIPLRISQSSSPGSATQVSGSIANPLSRCSGVAIGVSSGIRFTAASRSCRSLTALSSRTCCVGSCVGWSRCVVAGMLGSFGDSAIGLAGRRCSGARMTGLPLPEQMGGGAETVEGFNGARGLRNLSRTWFLVSGLFDPAPFARLRHAFDPRWASRFLGPAVPTWTTFLQSGHSIVLEDAKLPCSFLFLSYQSQLD